MSFMDVTSSPGWQEINVRPPQHVDRVISPNLDAALQYDERTRQASSQVEQRAARAPVGPTVHVGLPPPPRGTKKPRQYPPARPASPTLPAPEPVHATRPVKANPFVNPPPPQRDYRQGDVLIIGRPRRSSSISTVDSFRSDGSDVLPPHREQLALSQPSLPRPFERTRKGISTMFDGHGTSPSGVTGRGRSASTEDLPPVAGNTSPSERKSKLGRLLSSSKGQGSTSKYEVSTGVGGSFKDIDGTWRPQRAQRPLIVPTVPPPQSSKPSSSSSSAHGPSNSVSSTTSSSASSHEPLSEAEPRISISSTIYPSTIDSYSLYRRSHHTPSAAHSTFPHSPVQPNYQQDPLHSPPGSFMDLVSPTTPGFGDDGLTLTGNIQSPVSHPEDALFYAQASSPPTGSAKPPLPTTPKPNFYGSSHSVGSEGPGPNNTLNASERAALVNKSRKLAKVFGTTPAAVAVHHEELRLAALKGHGSLTSLDPPFKQHKRGTFSVSSTSLLSDWALPEGTMYISPNGRRTTTRQISNAGRSVVEEEDEDGASDGEEAEDKGFEPTSKRSASTRSRTESLDSFMDLSDDDTGNDDLLSELAQTPRTLTHGRRRINQHSSSSAPYSPSIFEAMTDEERTDEERKRKREKLARLHRFLGSRVPMELALGSDYSGLSPALPDLSSTDLAKEQEDTDRKVWMRRRRSSSAAAFPSSWSEDIERLKEDLNDEEKAQNVKRGKKMEKVFGVLPPQTLYHTRQSASPSLRLDSSPSSSKSKLAVPQSSGGNGRSSPDLRATSPRQSSFGKKHRKSHRPGTSESAQGLLPAKDKQSFGYTDAAGEANTRNVYNHYHQSLHSLHDILDRDDKESLAELHNYLNQDNLPEPALQEFSRLGQRRISNASSTKSERRRSLPARTSMASLNDEYSLASPKPDVTDFQLRRRRAAKLTAFFGVDYKDLIADVLESIEQGLEHESKRGTLNPNEVEDLLQKLRTLKQKRGGF